MGGIFEGVRPMGGRGRGAARRRARRNPAAAMGRTEMTNLPTSPVPGLVIALLLLHGPTGREIRVNSRSVTTLHASVPGQPNKALADGANCLINTTDGKFISVVETCEAVSRMIETTKP